MLFGAMDNVEQKSEALQDRMKIHDGHVQNKRKK